MGGTWMGRWLLVGAWQVGSSRSIRRPSKLGTGRAEQQHGQVVMGKDTQGRESLNEEKVKSVHLRKISQSIRPACPPHSLLVSQLVAEEAGRCHMLLRQRAEAGSRIKKPWRRLAGTGPSKCWRKRKANWDWVPKIVPKYFPKKEPKIVQKGPQNNGWSFLSKC